MVMAHGEQKRLPMLRICKQLLDLPLSGNIPILARTLLTLPDVIDPNDDAPSVTVVGPMQIADTLGFARRHDREVHGAFVHGGDPGMQVLRLKEPGNSLLRGLGAIRPWLAGDVELCGDIVVDPSAGDYRVVVLLGDVVFSRACLRALFSSRRPMEWAVTPDLSPSTGEVFGFSYSRDATPEVLACLDEVNEKPPAFEAYQPGTCRKLLWRWQAHRDAAIGGIGVVTCTPSVAECCTLITDFTKDIDTPEDLRRLSELDYAAWKDDQLDARQFHEAERG